jgi:hypothetical protein
MLPADITEADAASVSVDGDLLFEPQVRTLFRPTAESESGHLMAPNHDDMEIREWAATRLHARLSKFVKRTVGEHNVVIDDSISWIAFMGGTDPKERDFVVRRLYRALQAENVVTSGKLSSNGRPTILLTSDQRTRTEIIHFIETHTQGPTIKAIIDRLVK